MNRFNHHAGIQAVCLFFLLFTGSLPAVCDNIISSGTTVKVIPGTSMVSADNLVIKSGASLDNSGTLILKKNLTNEHAAPTGIGSGLAEFSGLINQTIAGQNVFNHLTVNNTAGITLGSHTQVNGNLTLTGGRVDLGSNNLTLGPSAAILGTPSAIAMIIATGSGELRKEFPAGFAGSFIYPVGDQTGTAEYSPVTLVVVSGSFSAGNYIGATLKNEKYPDPTITGNYLNRYWALSQSGITGLVCNGSFQYMPADVTGTENLISCTKVNPLPWTTYGLTNVASHLLTATGLTSFSTFTGLKSTTVPQNLEIVNVTIPNGATNCYDALQMLTVAGNGSVFVVENGGNVTLIAGEKISLLPGLQVYAGGYLLAKISTSFCGSMANPLVNNPVANPDQLLAADPLNKTGWIRIYPNPTEDKVTLEFGDGEAPPAATVAIYSIHGKTILRKELQNVNREQFSLLNLPVGIYLIQVRTDTRTELAKIIRK